MQKNILWILAVIIIAGGWYLFTTESGGISGSTDVITGQIKPVDERVPKDAADAISDVDVIDVNTQIAAKVPDAVVMYTDAGFAPSSVIVRKGQTVRWTNNSGGKVWPASAVHPSHEVYPQKSASDCLGSSFDACRGLSQGEYWDFKFDHVGEWKFHDHLNASQRGSVTVTE